MRRRFTLFWTLLIIALALSLPAATMAASFTYTVKKNTCTASGGYYGYGQLYFKVRMDEYGRSGANKFTMDAKLQHRNVGGSRWRTEYKWTRDTYTFPNNSASYSYVSWYSYQPNDFAWHRIVVTLKVWNGGTLLAKQVLRGKSC
jgi:hypothetical protein